MAQRALLGTEKLKRSASSVSGVRERMCNPQKATVIISVRSAMP